jgi:ABC-type transporter Mla subunit MlaD
MTMASHFKLGVFVVIAIISIVAGALGLGLSKTAATESYHTYFDESVAGLEVGAPVEFRGVTIGTVGKIAIAPDHQHIDVTLDIHQDQARRLDLLSSHMRAELAIQGITGVKFVDLGPGTSPPPTLGFIPAARYIPAGKSLLATLSSQVEALGPRLPELVDRASSTLEKLDHILGELDEAHVGPRVGKALDAVTEVGGKANDLAIEIKTTARDVGAVARSVRDVIDKSGRSALQSVADFGRRANASANELTRTIRDIGDAARAFRELVEEIEREPDVLLKGRARSKGR